MNNSALSEYLPIILDIIIVAIPLSYILIGRKKGFARIIIPLAVTIIFMAAGSAYAPVIAERTNDAVIHKQLTQSIENKINSSIDNGLETIEDSLPAYIADGAQSLGYERNALISQLKTDEASESIALYAEKILIIPLLTAIVYFAMYAISKIIGRLLVKPADLIARLPGIRACNNILGAVAGAIQGVLLTLIILIILSVILAFADNTSLAKAISETHVLNYLLDKVQMLF
ncbi:MAG: CvpA family protein [Clostridia bacterium]|nr:CvpA family protein [Clostridia bacterium]